MIDEQTLELIGADALLDKVRVMREQDWRLVQIGVTSLPEQLEINYSFDQDGRLVNLRVETPAAEPRVPSISSIYWCAVLYENEMHDLFKVRVDGVAVDFQGKFYTTAVPFAFGSTKAPAAKPAAAAAPSAPAVPATSDAGAR